MTKLYKFTSAGLIEDSSKMEYVLKAGRSLSSGVCRVAGALARGTRRMLTYVPLLGVTAVPVVAQDTEPFTVRDSKFCASMFTERRK